MDVLTDEQYEILAFIAICNRRNYRPTEQEVSLWRENPEPRPAKYRWVSDPSAEGLPPGLLQQSMMQAVANLQPITAQINAAVAAAATGWMRTLGPINSGRRELVTSAETVISHLVRLSWLERVDERGKDRVGLRLTDLGHALYSDVEINDATEEDLSVVVLGKDDPLAYPMLIGHLAGVGPGLLVDPYLKLDGLHALVVSTQLTRVLVSAQPSNVGVLAAMQVHLDSTSLSRNIEVRASKELHDRVVIGDEGDVYTLGSSLNGVGRKTTVFTPMPDSAAQALEDEYEELWEAATLVGPTPPPVEDDDSVEDEDDEDADSDDGGTSVGS